MKEATGDSIVYPSGPGVPGETATDVHEFPISPKNQMNKHRTHVETYAGLFISHSLLRLECMEAVKEAMVSCRSEADFDRTHTFNPSEKYILHFDDERPVCEYSQVL